MELKLIRERILGTPLVQSLPENLRQHFVMGLLWVAETKDVSRQDKLFVQGDEDEGTGCVVLEGMVKVCAEDNAVKHIEAPDVLGEVQLFTPQGRRTATVEVVVGGTVLTFSWNKFGGVLRELCVDEEMDTLKRAVAESAKRREENLFENAKG